MKKIALFAAMIVLGLATIGMAQPGQGGPGSNCGMLCGQPGMGGPGAEWDAGANHWMGRMGGRGGFNGIGGGMHAGMGIGMILRMGDDLKLTDDQKTKLQGLQTQFETEGIDQRAQLEKAQVKLRALMRDDKASDKDVLAAIDNVSNLRGEMMKMHYRHYSQAKAVLTADQIDQLKDMRKQRMGNRQGRMGQGRPGGGMGMGRGMGQNGGQDDDDDI